MEKMVLTACSLNSLSHIESKKFFPGDLEPSLDSVGVQYSFVYDLRCKTETIKSCIFIQFVALIPS